VKCGRGTAHCLRTCALPKHRRKVCATLPQAAAQRTVRTHAAGTAETSLRLIVPMSGCGVPVTDDGKSCRLQKRPVIRHIERLTVPLRRGRPCAGLCWQPCRFSRSPLLRPVCTRTALVLYSVPGLALWSPGLRAVVGGIIGAVWGAPFWGPPNSPNSCWIDGYFHRHCRYYDGRWHYY